MAERYWTTVGKRAWRESLQDVRWDNWGRIVITLFPLIIASIVAWVVLGDGTGALVRVLATVGATALMAGALFVWRMLTLPPVLAKEVSKAHVDQIEDLQSRIDEQERVSKQLAAENAKLKEPPPPPPRDPDGIFQLGEQVGRVEHHTVRKDLGQVQFGAVHTAGSFNPSAQFEFRGLLLAFGKADIRNETVLNGERRVSFANVSCQIVGKASH